VVKSLPLRSVLVALIGAAVYIALLWLLYGSAPYATIPVWWRHFLPNVHVSLVIWFILLNVGGAILAAIPVALGVVLATTARRAALALLIGAASALFIVVGGLMQFGLPPSVDGWVVDMAQFLTVSLAVVAMVALLQGFPLTIGWSDRGSRLR
jgi:hypothetical protein